MKTASVCPAEEIRAAARYRDPGDLCVIIPLFNVARSPIKQRNFALCHDFLRSSGIPSLVVECAFAGDPWLLKPSAEVLQVRTSTRLWQKERLINCGLARLPDRYTKVAWLDADILFQNPDWAMETSELLEDVAVVQLAERIVRLPRTRLSDPGGSHGWESFGSVCRRRPNAMLPGVFHQHGHTGFGWAARRSVLEPAGLYDACVAGGGDHVLAHAFCGDWESSCLTRMTGQDTLWYQHVRGWAKRVYPSVKARLGVVAGTALHLWHGELTSRRYDQRDEALRRAGFDPERDLALDEGGCWQWASDKAALHATLRSYLAARGAEAGEAADAAERLEASPLAFGRGNREEHYV